MSERLELVTDENLDRITRRFDGGGGGGNNDRMYARISNLETTMKFVERDLGEIKVDIREIKDHARTDFRLLFGALIAVALGLAGLMAKGFNWL